MCVFRLGILSTLVILESIFMLPVFAQSVNMNDMLTEVDQRLRNKLAKQNAIEAGRVRAVLCQSCHGEDGNSTKPDVPNLAGQNAGYLLEQINRFADGRREDFVMNQLAKDLSDEDKINVAIFYYSMPVTAQQVNWQLANKGEVLYKSRCASCHGQDGLGHKNLARLAGQQVEYVKAVLTAFRNTAKGVSPRSNIQRTSQSMENVTKNLTNEQIEELANFLGQLDFEDLD